MPVNSGGFTRRSGSPSVQFQMPERQLAGNALIDTGGILALLDRTDRWHRPCVAALEQLHLPLITSEAVLTELFHLVGDNSHEVSLILTIDHSDFETYRSRGNRRFRIVPSRDSARP